MRFLIPKHHRFYKITINYRLRLLERMDAKSISRANDQITITNSCDEQLNWIETQSMDNNGVVSHSRAYFDLSGQPLQSQSLNLSAQQVLASQTINDEYGRAAISILPTPTLTNYFQYQSGLVTDGSNDFFNSYDFDQLQNVQVGASTPGTAGWYYSANNTVETLVPQSSIPYSRQQFYQDAAGGVKFSAGTGERLQIGSGHESLTGTFPVANELDYYLTIRSSLVSTPSQLNNSLANQAVQTVVRDENGKYAVSIADKSGKTIMTARKGTSASNVLQVNNVVIANSVPTSPNYTSVVYFYILDPQPVGIVSTNATYTVEDLIAGQTYTVPQGNWAAGFYRLILTSGQVQVSYTNYFLDVACQFYNDAGRLVSSLSPNGYTQLRAGGLASYPTVDQTTYQYNNRGWLLNMTEPDAGKTQYLYRTDGSIRYSQNAKQVGTNSFSYTLYDQFVRSRSNQANTSELTTLFQPLMGVPFSPRLSTPRKFLFHPPK